MFKSRAYKLAKSRLKCQVEASAYARLIPTGTVVGIRDDDPEANQKFIFFKYSRLQDWCDFAKRLQHGIEGFARAAIGLIEFGTNPYVRITYWPYDFELVVSSILKGYVEGSPGEVNTSFLSSPIAAASIVRSTLETVVFRKDFAAALSDAETPSAREFTEALKEHRNAGLISDWEIGWANRAYEILSMVIHTGISISIGEVWILGKLAEMVRRKLKQGT